MTEQEIEATIRKYMAEKLDRDTLNNKLPQGTDEEIQQVFEDFVAGAHQALKFNEEWYRRLLRANNQDADTSIKWFIEQSDNLSKGKEQD